MQKMLEAAIEYSKNNLSVIPIGNDKKPLISWKEYQDRRASEEEIKAWYQKYPNANVGIVTGKVSGITVIDCDSPEAIKTFMREYKGDTPAVQTPRGMHFYFKYADGIRNTVKIGNHDMDIRGEGGYVVAPPSINAEGIEYKWIIDIALGCLEDMQKLSLYNNSINSLYNNYFLYKGDVDTKNNGSPQMSTTSTNVHNLFTQGRRDNDLFHVANCLVKGGCELTVVKYVLENLAQSCNPPFPEKEIDAKIQSAIERARRKERNLSSEIEEYVLSTNGHFLSTDVHKCLDLSTRQELKNASEILRRLCAKNIIEKYGDKNGSWRKVENDLEIIDWRNAETKEYPIAWPMNIQNLVKLYPSNIAVLAGASNTGKTTFMLELVRLNQRQHKVLYMNSEMGASELKLRLEMFHEVCSLSQWNFTAIERVEKFADAIDPDGLNIIDFMEIYDEFWKLAGWIRDVHKKLNKGVAVIAIQKKASKKKEQNDFGRGGEMTIEKPRLYLAMDRGKVKIVKAKIWRSPDRNPNGLIRDFKIVSGWKFIPSDDWYNEEDTKYRGFAHED